MVPEAADRDGVEYNGAGNEYDCVRQSDLSSKDDLNNGQAKYDKCNGRPGGMGCSKRFALSTATVDVHQF